MRSVGLVWAVAFVVLGSFELIERRWVAGLEPRAMRRLHLAKDAVSSMVTALVVVGLILRSARGLHPVSPAREDGPTQRRLAPAERVRLDVQWFISMRWIAVTLAAVLVYTALWIVQWLPGEVAWPLNSGVAALAATNLGYQRLLHRGVGLTFLLPAQAVIDLVILTWLLHFSGGLENPLCLLLVLHVIIAGILLSRRQCYSLAATASVLFTLMVLGTWSGILEHHSPLGGPAFEQGKELLHLAHSPLHVFGAAALETTVLFLTAFFVTTLAERTRTDERRLEALAESARAGQQLLENALDTTGAGMRVLNPNLEIRWASDRWKEWVAAHSEVVPPPAALLDGEHSPAYRCVRDGQARVTELVFRPLDDGSAPGAFPGASPATFQLTTAPLKDATGAIRQVVELVQNIGLQKEAQTQRVRAARLATLGQIAGHVAHEVNNPMAIIAGKTRLLLSNRRQEVTPKVAGELAKIAEQADRVARIVQGLLSYCRLSRAPRAGLNICVPIRKSLAAIAADARQAGVSIHDTLPEVLPPVHANAGELEQVFLNLFRNALEAMPQGGELRISALTPAANREAAYGLVVVVEDTGIGVPADIRMRIFEPFFTTKRDGRRAGLGLAACQGLVRSHGGKIEVESEPGAGTRFTVKLPTEPRAGLEEQPAYG